MKVYCCKELKTMSIDELLELLFIYNNLKKSIYDIMEYDPENEKSYIDNNLYYYELNVMKIKNELEVKIKKDRKSVV